MALSCIIAEVKLDIGRKSRFFIPCISYHAYPVRSPCRNIATTYGVEKTEWFGYQTVQKVWEYV